VTWNDEKWLRVVLPKNQTPRFPRMCCFCGRDSPSRSRRIKILVEQRAEVGWRMGESHVTPPQCHRCRWQRRITILTLMLVFAWMAHKSIGDPYAKSRATSHPWWKVSIFAIGLGGGYPLALQVFKWLGVAVDVVERADGIHYSYRVRSVAEAFARENAPIREGSSPELLPPPAPADR